MDFVAVLEGDGIMALFGAPLAHEDHAVRACYAALAMQAAVQQYASEVQRTNGVPLQMRVGLNAGEVVVRAIGNDLHEDLHWIDTETQALLNSLVESLPMARLLLLVNYRPEYQHGWGSKTYYAQLRLDPLPPASADEVLQALLGDDPSLTPFKPRLVARTEGNPFFLEESVRVLVETGVLVGEPGAYRLAQALPTIQVPATVQAVLAARIDRLPPEEKRLLQTAAVVGTEVPLPLLQAIADMPEATLFRGLEVRQAAEFLYETRLFPEPEYTFRHALTHEVAYSSLLLERRRELHARIVAAIEQLHADRLAHQVEQLVHHALRGELWDKALLYCYLSEGHWWAARLEEAAQSAVRALELARAHHERGYQAYALRLLGDIAAHREPLESTLAAAYYQQALTLAEELGMRPLQAHCHRGLGTLYAATGQREPARTALSTAIALYRDMDIPFWLPQAEAAMALVEGR